jgi:methyl-accepting chemotaxis protein
MADDDMTPTRPTLNGKGSEDTAHEPGEGDARAMLAEAARHEAEHFRRLAEQAREVRDQQREALEQTRGDRERLRDAAEAGRSASEEARRAAEEARCAAEDARQAGTALVLETADTLKATLEKMQRVENMRRGLRVIRDADEREPH